MNSNAQKTFRGLCVEIDKTGGKRAPVVLGGGLAPCGGHRPERTGGRPVRQFANGAVERGGVARGKRYRRVGMRRAELAEAADVACENWQPRRPRLENDNPERLVPARERERVPTLPLR